MTGIPEEMTGKYGAEVPKSKWNNINSFRKRPESEEYIS